jgi:predicted membrane channel-forming protein YqfA (hemolysin III family)
VAERKDPEDLDRELIELLNELRVALPGVQVLFAFLLTVPFTNRFAEVTDFQEQIYFAALLFTMSGTVFLMAPTSYHRIRWRDQDKEQMLRTSNKLALVGLVMLACALTSVVYLVTDVLYSDSVTAGVLALTIGLIAWIWFGLPLSRELRDRLRS